MVEWEDTNGVRRARLHTGTNGAFLRGSNGSDSDRSIDSDDEAGETKGVSFASGGEGEAQVQQRRQRLQTGTDGSLLSAAPVAEASVSFDAAASPVARRQRLQTGTDGSLLSAALAAEASVSFAAAASPVARRQRLQTGTDGSLLRQVHKQSTAHPFSALFLTD